MEKIIIGFLLINLISFTVYSAPPVRSDKYVSQTTIDPAAVTRNEDRIFTYLQAGVDTLANNSVTSAKIVDGTITNADVNASAGIVQSKLATLAITSALITNNEIVNADINSSAAILGSKLDLAIPGAIGGTTPATGVFTTLGSTGQASLNTLEIGGSGAVVTTIENNDSLGTSDTKLPTQGNVKAYVDDNATNADAVVKAWINFTGSGTVAIKDSFNVDTLTDNATGQWTITWDTDFADTNYAITTCYGDAEVNLNTVIKNQATTGAQFNAFDAVGTAFQDVSSGFMIAIGDQ